MYLYVLHIISILLIYVDKYRVCIIDKCKYLYSYLIIVLVRYNYCYELPIKKEPN